MIIENNFFAILRLSNYKLDLLESQYIHVVLVIETWLLFLVILLLLLLLLLSLLLPPLILPIPSAVRALVAEG